MEQEADSMTALITKNTILENNEITEYGISFFNLSLTEFAKQMCNSGYIREVGFNYIEWCFLGWERIIKAAQPHASYSKVYKHKIQLLDINVWKWFCLNMLTEVDRLSTNYEMANKWKTQIR